MKKLLFISVALLPAVASAHVGNHSLLNLSAGFMHPLTGLDHLLALLATGIWMAQSETRPKMGYIAGFGILLALGIFVGSRVGHVDIEPGIAATLVVLGTFIAAAVRGPSIMRGGRVGLTALIHGFVHGAELPSGAGVLSFSVGLVSGSLVAIAIATVSGVYANPVARGLLTRAAGAILMMGALISVF